MDMSEEPGTCSECGSLEFLRAKWVSGRTGARTLCERCVPAFLASKARPPARPAACAPAECAAWLFDPGRSLTRDEAERIYPGQLHPRYGEPLSQDGGG